MSDIESLKYATEFGLISMSKNRSVFAIWVKGVKSEQIGPASMLQVALVPPYKEVDNAVKPIPKSDGEARRYAIRGHIEDMREHERKKLFIYCIMVDF